MLITERSKLWRLAVAVLLAGICGSVSAQVYPTRPVRIVVGYPPGGATDIGARILAQQLTIALGQPVLVDNRAGAGGNIGTEYVAKSPPDGYTIGWIGGTTTINASWDRKLGYDVLKDFSPISQVTSMAHLILVHPSLPVKSVAELIALAKASPGKLDYSTSGGGTAPHLAAEWFKTMVGVDLVHIGYKGTNPQLVDLLGGTVKIAFPTMPLMPEYIKQGKLRALAVTTSTRSPLLPDVPTMKELGYPDYVVNSWHGMAFSAGTPKEIVARLHRETVKILDMQSVREKLELAGFAVEASASPEQFSAYIEAETRKWARIIKDAKLSAD